MYPGQSLLTFLFFFLFVRSGRPRVVSGACRMPGNATQLSQLWLLASCAFVCSLFLHRKRDVPFLPRILEFLLNIGASTQRKKILGCSNFQIDGRNSTTNRLRCFHNEHNSIVEFQKHYFSQRQCMHTRQLLCFTFTSRKRQCGSTWI